ncbi:hypothetical protein ATANTOWER_019828 [Ataeniobius toweri]|uniref:Uncharacterized protein n=1 Tax=Ataeniobius toweri TaxID=208326 RepID=A0ABU7CLS1_9TELE|nr:hypothetical protein [Ataeniobius toweri]
MNLTDMTAFFWQRMLAHPEKQHVSKKRGLCRYIPVYLQHEPNVRQTQDRWDLRWKANQQPVSGFNRRWKRNRRKEGKYNEHNAEERDWMRCGKSEAMQPSHKEKCAG